MLYRNSDILIFDEPTAVLTPQEIIELMKIMKNFTKEGKTIILITHKLNEIKEVADRTTVLRRGKQVGVLEVKNVSTHEMAELMVGRKINFNIDKNTIKKGNVVLEVKNLTLKKKNIDIDQIRELIINLNKSSFNNKKRFVLIDNIELLNLNSVNALLKVLEEPNENINFILINNNKKEEL